MSCKFDYIEKMFGESNPELAKTLNEKHLNLIKEMLKSGNYEVSPENKLVVKKADVKVNNKGIKIHNKATD